MRDLITPADDAKNHGSPPLAVAGTAEVREYQACGVLYDQQIGQPRDIVSVTLGGKE